MFEILNIVAAIVTLGLGIYGLSLPQKAAQLVRLEATDMEGFSEFRASFGGLWIGLGAVPLITMEPLAFAMAGVIWLSAAIGRGVSFALDKTITRQNMINVCFEVACGAFLLIGTPWLALTSQSV